MASFAASLVTSDQVLPLREKIQAAPAKLLSWGAPTIAVLPSVESATAPQKLSSSVRPVHELFGARSLAVNVPCSLQSPLLRTKPAG